MGRSWALPASVTGGDRSRPEPDVIKAIVPPSFALLCGIAPPELKAAAHVTRAVCRQLSEIGFNGPSN